MSEANNVQVPRFREAFERHAPEIRAVPESELLPINIDIAATVTTVIGAWQEIHVLRDDFLKHAPTFDIKLFDSLESWAMALGHAQTLYETATEPPASLVALLNEAIKTREVLLADVNALISRSLIDPMAIKDLRGVNGHRNVAFDVLALANVLKKNWAKVSGRTGVKAEELDAAEVLAEKLVTAVGEREQAPVIAAQAVRDRQQTFTKLVNAYDEVRSVIAYLRRKQGDVDEIAPSLYAGRATGKKKPTEETANRPVTTGPVTGAGGTTTTQPTTSGGTGATATAPTAVSATHPGVSATGPYV
jgi:hypothetical protein